jgi:hypothetical protein
MLLATNTIANMSRRKLLFNQVVALFLGNEDVKSILDCTLLSYDYNKRLVLHNGKQFEVMFSASQIKMATGYEFDFSVFKEVIHYFAKLNTPMPEESPDILLEPISQYIEDNSLERLQVRDIVRDVFKGSMKDLTNRQLEMRISSCLVELGWKKSRQSKGSFWLKRE